MKLPEWLDGTILGMVIMGGLWLFRAYVKTQQKKADAEGTINDQAAKAVSTVDGLLEDSRAENHQLRAQLGKLQDQLGSCQQAFATFAIDHSSKLQADINGLREGFGRQLEALRQEHGECRGELAAIRGAMHSAGIKVPNSEG